jgi:hypothetical protein
MQELNFKVTTKVIGVVLSETINESNQNRCEKKGFHWKESFQMDKRF